MTTDNDRFVFLAYVTYVSTLHHNGDVTSSAFRNLIDKLEHYDHPGMWNGVTDCIQSSEVYANVVGNETDITYDQEKYLHADNIQKIVSLMTPGIWNLELYDGLKVHELVLHSFPDQQYRIVQSNVGKYTMAQFCFHLPTPPQKHTDYERYGLPYTHYRTSGTRAELIKFLDDIEQVSQIPSFSTVRMRRLQQTT